MNIQLLHPSFGDIQVFMDLPYYLHKAGASHEH